MGPVSHLGEFSGFMTSLPKVILRHAECARSHRSALSECQLHNQGGYQRRCCLYRLSSVRHSQESHPSDMSAPSAPSPKWSQEFYPECCECCHVVNMQMGIKLQLATSHHIPHLVLAGCHLQPTRGQTQLNVFANCCCDPARICSILCGQMATQRSALAQIFAPDP